MGTEERELFVRFLISAYERRSAVYSSRTRGPGLSAPLVSRGVSRQCRGAVRVVFPERFGKYSFIATHIDNQKGL